MIEKLDFEIQKRGKNDPIALLRSHRGLRGSHTVLALDLQAQGFEVRAIQLSKQAQIIPMTLKFQTLQMV